MKKYLLMALAAVLFAACGDDDPEPTPTPDPEPTIDLTDYSKLIDASYTTMLKELGDPEMAFGNYYAYTMPEGSKTTGLTIAVNPDNQKVYMVMQLLAKDAYTVDEVANYFSKSYHFLELESDMEEGTKVWTYGNQEKEEDCTLTITISDGVITYLNPQNKYEEPESEGFDSMTPISAVQTFMGMDIEDVFDEYGEDMFIEVSGMYMASCEGELMSAFSLSLTDGVVSSMIILYNEELDEEEILSYYTEQGYTCTKTEEADDEGNAKYILTNDDYRIEYQGWRSVITPIAD